MDHEREEVEQIPWAMLADELGDARRTRLATIALAVGAAVVAGVVAFHVLRRPAGTMVDLAPATAAEEPAPEVASGDPGTTTTTETPPTAAAPPEPPPPALYSEADLMAVLPTVHELAVAAHAEWFVSDFFTVLGAATAGDAPRDGWPRPVAEEGGYSWVAWVRSAHVSALDAGRFDVTVLYRTLRRDDAGDLVRAAVQAVVVEVAVDGDGGIAVAGLPRPVPASPPAPAALQLVDPPPTVAAAARNEVQALGSDLVVEGAVEQPDGWRVVVSFVDSAAVRWPLMVDVAELSSDPES